MQQILKSSIFVRALSAFFSWIGVKWHESCIVSRYLSPRIHNTPKYSVTMRATHAARRFWSAVFKSLRLDKFFAGSIFQQAFIWCLLPVVLAPLLPTTAAMVLVMVGIFAVLVRFGSMPDVRAPRSPVNKYVVLFAIVYLIATLSSVTLRGSLFSGLLTVLTISFTLAFSNAVTSARQADFAVRLIVLVGGGVAAYGLYQYFFYDPAVAGAWIDDDMFSSITHRVYSTLGNPNVLGEYLLLVTPLAAACALTAKTTLRKLFFFAVLVVMVLCMFMTYSRGGYIGLILAAAVFIVMLDARFILVGLLGLVALYFVLPPEIIERFTSIGNLQDSSTSYRVSIWLGTIAMLRDYWFTGVGPGNTAFNLIYPAYSFNTVAAPHAHNLFLQLTCDTGIVGLVLFLFVVGSFYRETFSAFARQKDRRIKIHLAAVAAAVSGFLLQGLTDYSFYNSRVTLIFWVVIALGMIYARVGSMKKGHFIWSES